MRAYMLLSIAFYACQALAVINSVEKTTLKEQILRSTVNVLKYNSDFKRFDAENSCTGAIISKTKIVTALHCLTDGGKLRFPPIEAKGFAVQFVDPKTAKKTLIKIKNYHYSAELASIHKWAMKFEYDLADLDKNIEGNVRNEVLREVLIRVGGDTSRVQFQDTGYPTEDFANYMKAFIPTLPKEQQVEIMNFDDSKIEARLKIEIQKLVPKVRELLASYGFDGDLNDLNRFASERDIVVLELEKETPQGFSAVNRGTVELREGSDLEAWISGSGRSSTNLQAKEEKKIRIGKVKLSGKVKNQFVLRSGPSRICNGDSGGPLFIDNSGKAELVGINVAMDYGNKTEEKNELTDCAADVPTYSIDLKEFKQIPGL